MLVRIQDGKRTVITAVCISKEKQSLHMDIPFVSYTEDYQPLTNRDTKDLSRIAYLTSRYNSAIRRVLSSFPETQHILIVDHYYLQYTTQIQRLINDYKELKEVTLGASIWYWARLRIRPWIAYYDTTSAPEFLGKKWWNPQSLPKGIVPVSGIGACWILPRELWERTRGFTIPSPPQAGSTRGLDTTGYKVLLDCDSRLWRTHETNPGIPNFSMPERVLITAKSARRRLITMMRR